MAPTTEICEVYTFMHMTDDDGKTTQMDHIKEEVAPDHVLLKQSCSPSFIEREEDVEPGTPKYSVISLKYVNGEAGFRRDLTLTPVEYTVAEYKIVSQAFLAKHCEKQSSDVADAPLEQQCGELVLAQQGQSGAVILANRDQSGDAVQARPSNVLVVACLGREVADLDPVLDEPCAVPEQHLDDSVIDVPIKALEWLEYVESESVEYVEAESVEHDGDAKGARYVEFVSTYYSAYARVASNYAQVASGYLAEKGKVLKNVALIFFLILMSLVAVLAFMAMRLRDDGLEKAYETHHEFARIFNTTRSMASVANDLTLKAGAAYSIGKEIGASEMPGKDEIADLIDITASSMRDTPRRLHSFTHNVWLMAVRLQEDHASTLRDLERRGSAKILSWDTVKHGMAPSTRQISKQWIAMTVTLHGTIVNLVAEAEDLHTRLKDIERSTKEIENKMSASRETQLATHKALTTGWLRLISGPQAAIYEAEIKKLTSLLPHVQAARDFVARIQNDVVVANDTLATIESLTWLDESVGFVKWFTGRQKQYHASLTRLVSAAHYELYAGLQPTLPHSQ